jgi:hypothetical protein
LAADTSTTAEKLFYRRNIDFQEHPKCSGRLLLGDAVNTATACKNLFGVNKNYLSTGVNLFEYCLGN